MSESVEDAARRQFSVIEGEKKNLVQLIRSPDRPLQTGGGGGTYDGMEPRVAKLEAGVAHLERDVGELRIDMRDVRDRLARLEERVSHLPSKGFITSGFLVTLAFIAGLIAFQVQVQTFVAGQPEAATPASP